jgi:hypothetical protein
MLKELNDGSNSSAKIKVSAKMFADDTVIMTESVEKLKKSFNIVKVYCEEWEIEWNVNKTSSSEQIVKFAIDGEEIKRNSSIKYLGVVENN